MGRIGKRILEIPKGVEVKVIADKVVVKGPKGTLGQTYLSDIKVVIENNTVKTLCQNSSKAANALQGLYNSLIANMIKGVTEGFEKRLEIVGVGYKAAKQGNNLQLQMGYSHPVIIEAPQGIEIVVEGNTKVVVKGSDKQVVGQVAATIKQVRSVEPYKGKGIRYAGQRVRKKAGKAAKVAGGAG